MMILGVSTDVWNVVLAAINTAVVLVGVPLALSSLRHATAQRMNDSLAKFLDEYRSEHFRDAVRRVVDKFPIYEGDAAARTKRFVTYGADNINREDIVAARDVVHKLNDLAALIDRGAIRDLDFYGQAYLRMVELGRRLDPYILAVSARRGFRWGFRIRRLSVGAVRYCQTNRLHRKRDLVIDGVALSRAGRHVFARAGVRLRRLLGRKGYIPTSRGSLKTDEMDLQSAAAALQSFSESDLVFLDLAV